MLKLHCKMPPPQSKAWSYFKRDMESKIVKCKLCNLEMTYTGGTSNMFNHLKLKHSNLRKHNIRLHKIKYEVSMKINGF